MLFVPPQRQQDVKERLRGLIHVPCNIEFSGSQIIFFDLETDYSCEDRLRMDDQPASFREMTDKPG